jgi:hypothetical protein
MMKVSVPIIALIILSTAVFAQSNVNQTLISLSNTHIMQIANDNVSSVSNSYIQSPTIFINMGNTNFTGIYSGQTGIAQMLANLTSYGTPYLYYVTNTSIIPINGTEYDINRDVWFVSQNQSYTLQIPYSATYVYSNGGWLISAEFFGSANHYGTAIPGFEAPANITTTILTSSVTTTVLQNITTTLLYTIPSQNGSSSGTAGGNGTGTPANQSSQAQQPSLLIVVGFILAIAIVILYLLSMRRKS